jgi:hypothetical protein
MIQPHVPTRVNHILDLLLSSSESILHSCRVSTPFSSSDHSSIHFEIDFSAPNFICSPVYDFQRAHYDNINRDLCNINWNLVFCTDDIDLCYDNICNNIENSIRSFVPLKKPLQLKSPPHLKRLLSRCEDAWDCRLEANGYDKYFKLKRRYRKECRKFEQNSEKLVVNSSNPKHFYAYVNSRVNNREKPVVSVIDPVSKSLLTSPPAIADIFASYFSSVYSTVVPNDFPAFPSRGKSEMDGFLFDIHAVSNAMLKIKDKISLTPESIPSYFIRRCSVSLAPVFTRLFNMSLVQCTLPSPWKTAIVAPLFKKGSRTDAKNYRPISLTSSICKIFEVIIKEKILSHLLKHNLINCNQFGFLPGKSTATQILLNINNWLHSLEKGIQTDAIYIDFCKAFDRVSHKLLLYKLKSYGISAQLVSWLEAYLSDRNFSVKIGNSFSSHALSCPSGVPQGSILGPLLFLIFINDLPDTINSHVFMFADDVKIFRSIIDPPYDFLMLQRDLNCIQLWCETWDMEVSSEKSLHLQLFMKHDCPFYFSGQQLNSYGDNDTVRDLGLLVSPSLNFSDHISMICTKSQCIGFLILRAICFPNIRIYRKCFITYVRPLLEYCTVVWNPSSVLLIQQLENVQRKFTRIAYIKSFPNSPIPDYESRLAIFNLQTLQSRRLINDLVLCYKIVHGFENHPLFSNMFSRVSRPSRSSNCFQLKRTHTYNSKLFDSFSFRVIRSWNLLPDSVVSSQTVTSFKARVSNHPIVTSCS